jgi:hypothetical protein
MAGVDVGVHLVEGKGAGRGPGSPEAFQNAAAPRTGLQFREPQGADQLGLEVTVGGQQRRQDGPLQRF